MVFEKHRAWVVGNDSATVGGVSYGVRDQVFGAVRPSQRGARRVIFSSWLARVFGLGLRGPGLLCVLSLDGPAARSHETMLIIALFALATSTREIMKCRAHQAIKFALKARLSALREPNTGPFPAFAG